MGRFVITDSAPEGTSTVAFNPNQAPGVASTGEGWANLIDTMGKGVAAAVEYGGPALTGAVLSGASPAVAIPAAGVASGLSTTASNIIRKYTQDPDQLAELSFLDPQEDGTINVTDNLLTNATLDTGLEAASRVADKVPGGKALLTGFLGGMLGYASASKLGLDPMTGAITGAGVGAGLSAGKGQIKQLVERKIRSNAVGEHVPDAIHMLDKIEAERVASLPAPARRKATDRIKRFIKGPGNEGVVSDVLTLTQLNPQEGTFVAGLNNLLNTFPASGISRKNERAVEEALQGELNKSIASFVDYSSDSVGFGKTMEMLFGPADNRVADLAKASGRVTNLIQASKTALYAPFNKALANLNQPVDASAILKWSDMNPTAAAIRTALEKRPELKLPGFAYKKPTATKSSVREFQTKSDITTAIDGRIPTQKLVDKTGKIISAATTTDTSPGLPTKDELAAQWTSLTPTQAQEIGKVINSLYKDGNPDWNNDLAAARGVILRDYNRVLEANPDVLALKKTADNFYAKKEDLLNQEMVRSLQKRIADKPSELLDYISSGEGGAMYDKLGQIEKLYMEQGEATNILRAKGFAMEAPTDKMLKEGFDRDILTPVRTKLVKDAINRETGAVDAAVLRTKLMDMKTKERAVYERVWGKDAIEDVEKLANALQGTTASSHKASAFVRWQQSRVILTAAALGAGLYTGDVPSAALAAGGTALALSLSPVVLARVLHTPAARRHLINGIETYNKTGSVSTLGRVTRRIAAMGAFSDYKQNATQDSDKEAFLTQF